ncbi:CG31445 [Drosophila busckii]|uniref:CG31445 n=1 Tax=Drosophila busckii TaxID=30019 RepID=A0A0M4EJW4_DROBS|nr:CG31445 [Drosophila busckii]
MDQLAVPDFSAGAMENWGLITYREAALFYAPDVSSEADKQRVTNIIAHELAHQWFGNMVTMSWWDDLWIKEGFATYIATLGMEKMCCKWNAYEEESLDNMLAILSTDAYCSTRPIHQPVTTANQIGGLFDPITYRKGAVIIRMMHMFIGDMAFRLGLNNYIERQAYGNAKQEDLWQALTQIAHDHSSLPKDLCLQTIMDSWTLQKGYPLIKVRRHYTNKCAVISQSRFKLQPEQQPNARQDQLFEQKRQYCWLVPISYTSELAHNFNSTEPQVWLRCTPKGEPLPLRLRYLPGEFEWIILNVQLTAPYRVDYDSCNWRLLIDALKGLDFQQIHVLNRAQLIDDAMTLAWTGQRS